MKWHRISALYIRHLYLYKRSVPRMMDIFFWPIVELLVWGFLSFYLEKVSLGKFNIVAVLLGGIIFWDLLSQSQRSVSTAFLEEVWERNFLNIFVTPLKLSEFIASTVLVAFTRIALVGIVMGVLSFFLYKFNILQFGFLLIPFLLNLLLFGWIIGLFATAVIFRFGTSAQVLAFGLIFLIQPFSAVFYPVSALPKILYSLAYALPSTYVFEGMREVIKSSSENFIKYFAGASIANAIYLVMVLLFFYAMFNRVKKKGMLLKLD